MLFMNVLRKFKAHVGEFWWYSLLVFLACRSGDVIQAFIGLWLVPAKVSPNELGAVLPLQQFASVVALPLCVLLAPLSRFLSIYAARGEYGKVKRLLQTAFGLAGLTVVVLFLVARFILPFFFERMRIAEGSLGMLVLACGLFCNLTPVFTNALQGLKKFNAVACVNALGAPVRLVVMLLAMPFRALSGYMLGQVAPAFLTLIAACVSLRKELGRGVKSMPFFREDGGKMLRYMLPVAMGTIVATLCGSWEAILVRQRLPEVESAAWYMISRLADIGTYVGISLMFVVFPMAAEAEAKGTESKWLLAKLLGGTFGAGVFFTLLYLIAGRFILSAVPLWRTYAGYSSELVVLTMRQTLFTTMAAFGTYEGASGRFRFLWYTLPLTVIEAGVLGMSTGYGLFESYSPAFASWLKSLDAAHIGFFLWWMTAMVFLQLICMMIHLCLRRCCTSQSNAGVA